MTEAPKNMNESPTTSIATSNDRSHRVDEFARLRQAVRTSRRVHLFSSVAFLWLGISVLLYWKGVETRAAIAFTAFGVLEIVGATQLIRRPVPWAIILAVASTALSLAIAWAHINASGLLTLPPRHVFDLIMLFAILSLHWDAVPSRDVLAQLRQQPELLRGESKWR